MTTVDSSGAGSRAVAARAIDAVLHDGRSLKAVLADALPTLPDPRDRALVEAICFQALRHARRYRFVLQQWMQRPLPAREHLLESLLLAGLAQLDALGLPAHAAVAATAEAARNVRKPAFVGLVNALLRRAAREPLPVSEDPAIAHSYPDWLIARLRADWPQQWQDVLAAGNTIAPMWLRVNAATISRDAYAQRLREAGIDVDVPTWPPEALRLDVGVATETLPGWSEGLVSVQDAAAQAAVAALALREGERVLDMCCAPGGKTAAMLETAAIDLLALDSDARRMRRVESALERLHLRRRVRLRVADASDVDAWWDGEPFDAVLLDAPCSATGIIRRQPDIKWHRRETDIAVLTAVQDRLLDAAWRVLRPGGRLLYATCSILREENAARIAAFLARTHDAIGQPLDECYGEPANPGRQRLPGAQGMDGFYYALLGKDSSSDTALAENPPRNAPRISSLP
ncbi:MAG: 16S rRNA (cytosine(967)-C(5))-methyltransferase RsmB [Proteobacteria bacterium]|nr:16S rRNA (cytosine(967)-C(5))-methyltransferase RsmB [Pseudomonadota bacterium]